MASNYSKSLYNQYVELLEKFEEQGNLLKENNRLIKSLNATIDALNELAQKQSIIIEEQTQEILRLKSKNNKDSSNSSKPSSTNGFKKVITNRREKSEKSKGGQKNHKPHSLNNKLEQFINSGNVQEEIIEINKNEFNKNKRYIEKVVIDITVTKSVKKYRYYPCEDGKYHIPKIHNQYVQYGSVVKAMAIDLINNLYNSTDGVTRFIEEKIEEKLLDSYYLNHDESQIKIDGDGHNILCACNNKYVRLWQSKHKSQEAIDEIDFLPKYKGVIVKDGTELYNKYGCFLSQCISHILRYLKGIYDFIDHKSPKKMAEFLSKYNTKRKELIEKGIKSFNDNEYSNIIKEYELIIDEWEKELREDTNNYLFDDELKLWTRMKYDNKKMDKIIRGDKEEILYFLKDLNVPATNNEAEVAQRGAKIKQKI